jgi:hypothetical protein
VPSILGRSDSELSAAVVWACGALIVAGHPETWAPLSPSEVPVVLAAVAAPWWLAGGWALDAFLGRTTRLHEDTDVLILRPDHVEVRRVLSEWDAHWPCPKRARWVAWPSPLHKE